MTPSTDLHSFPNHLVSRARVGVVGLLLSLAGCVTTPNSGASFDPHQSVQFAGFVSEPDEFVRVQARRKDTGAWVTVAELLPETDVFNAGGETWFEWQGGMQLDLRPEWKCFFTASCTTPLAILSAQFRVVQSGGSPSQLYTRTVEQAACMNPLILDIGLEEAYDACGERRQTSTLYWDNRPSFPGGTFDKAW